MTVALPMVAHKANTSELLPLDEYDVVLCQYSGGKDSLSCILHLLELGVPKAKLQLWHQCVDGEPGANGLMDWPVTEAYVRATGIALGIETRFQWKEGGFEREMNREGALTAPIFFEKGDGAVGRAGGLRGKLATRKKFPQVSGDLSVRWCSPYLKIDVGAIALNNSPEFAGKKILFITGERRQEGRNGKGRALYAEVEKHRCSSNRRRVDGWRPVIDWTEEQVWAIIRRWHIRVHGAYFLGWGRVSCMACIFGDKDQWASVRELDRGRFDRIAAYEQQFGLTIKKGRSVTQQADAGTPFVGDAHTSWRELALGRVYEPEWFFFRADEAWQQPAGAYKRCGGPI